jgi:hypothetical protein
LQDEIISQLMKFFFENFLLFVIRSLRNNDNKNARDRIWELLYLCFLHFIPSPIFEKFVIKFLKDEMDNIITGKKNNEENLEFGNIFFCFYYNKLLLVCIYMFLKVKRIPKIIIMMVIPV